MLQESRFIYKDVNKSPEAKSQPETAGKAPASPDDFTKGESEEKATENLFYTKSGSRAEKLKSFLIKLGDEGVMEFHFEKDAVSYWKDGNEYRIPADLFREVENLSDQEAVKQWLIKLGENPPRELVFNENGLSYWHESKKYNIPAELLR